MKSGWPLRAGTSKAPRATKEILFARASFSLEALRISSAAGSVAGWAVPLAAGAGSANALSTAKTFNPANNAKTASFIMVSSKMRRFVIGRVSLRSRSLKHINYRTRSRNGKKHCGNFIDKNYERAHFRNQSRIRLA
jgi:hypothetical protein